MTTDSMLELKLEDRINGQAVTPSHISLPMLNLFNKQVADFLRGSHQGIDLEAVPVCISEGSYRLIAPLALLMGLPSDLTFLAANNLDDMDPKRAAVVEQWQQAAHKNPDRRYFLSSSLGQAISISSKSDYQRQRNEIWLTVEKYLYGKVEDLGGAKQPNLHLRGADGGLQKIHMSQDKVLQEERNLVYRHALLRVRADQELATGKLRNIYLLDFVDYKPAFDAAAFENMTAKGRKAWAGVPNASQWVEELRGSV